VENVAGLDTLLQNVAEDKRGKATTVVEEKGNNHERNKHTTLPKTAATTMVGTLVVFRGPVRSGYGGSSHPNRDRDRLGYFCNPAITEPNQV